MPKVKMLTITVAVSDDGEELSISIAQSHAFKRVAKKMGRYQVTHVLNGLAKDIRRKLLGLECANE